MNRVLLLLSHVPCPRIKKRIKSLKKLFDEVYILYWNRTHGNGFVFENNSNINVTVINSEQEPNLINRLIENNKLIEQTKEEIYGNMLKNFDLIYVSGVEILPVAKEIAKDIGAKIVVEIADIPANTHKKKLGILWKFLELRINKILISDSYYYVLTSPGYLEYYKSFGINSKNVFIFENVPKKSVFENFQITSDRFLRKEQLTIGYIGATAYYKSLKTLLKASLCINEIKVLIAGKGPDTKRVEMEVNKIKNIKDVIFIPEYNYEKDIVKLYSQTDIVYSVYNTDNFNVRLALPNKLYEGIVSGRPLIVSTGTYLEKYVKELGIGFSVKHGDVEELKRLLSYIVKHRDVLVEMSKKCEKLSEQYYYENFEDSFLNWLRNILN